MRILIYVKLAFEMFSFLFGQSGQDVLEPPGVGQDPNPPKKRGQCPEGGGGGGQITRKTSFA